MKKRKISFFLPAFLAALFFSVSFFSQVVTTDVVYSGSNKIAKTVIQTATSARNTHDATTWFSDLLFNFISSKGEK